MTLLNGQSEIDTVVLRLPDLGKTITNWSSYHFNSGFLKPTDSWSFTISGEDLTLYQQLLVGGTKVQLSINERIQCTGYIDVQNISYEPKSGTVININGRDILAKMVNANADPTFQFQSSMTVGDLINGMIVKFGIRTVYNTQDTNLNIITGRPNNQSVKTSIVNTPTTTFIRKNPNDLKLTPVITNVPTTQVTSNIKPGLSKLPIKEFKPRINEGAYAYIERLIKREGLMMKAVADGSGIMVISPDFTGPVDYQIIQKKDDTSNNNVLRSQMTMSQIDQPSLIVATGFGTNKTDIKKSRLKVIMINELAGLDENGNPYPQVQAEIAKWPNASILPIRKELIPKNRPFNTANAFCPIYLTDDEAKDIAQLQKFVTRKMGEFQQKSLNVRYTVLGHTQNGAPWAVNTLVNVDDDINNIHQIMWVMDKTFSKNLSGGTTTELVLIKPYTLLIG